MKLRLKSILLAFTCITSVLSTVSAQIKIGDQPTTLDNSALLELKSTKKGFLPPRMTSSEVTSISNPANGLVVYNTEIGCLYINVGSTTATPAASWTCLSATQSAAKVSKLSCDSAVFNPAFATDGQAYSGTVSIPYTGGSGTYTGGTSMSSSGTTGLILTSVGGTLSTSGSAVFFQLVGVPTVVNSSTSATFSVNLLGQTCALSIPTYPLAQSKGCIIQQPASAYEQKTVNGLRWITRNLGASASAASAFDVREETLGCLFQINASSPNIVTRNGWIATSPADNPGLIGFSSWALGTDPCRVNLGSPWRLPTISEANSMISTLGITNLSTGFDKLKFSITGLYRPVTGAFDSGEYAFYPTSTYSVTSADTYDNVFSLSKSSFTISNAASMNDYMLPVRCVR